LALCARPACTTVANQDPARSAGQAGSGGRVAAVSDQRPPQQQIGGGIDDVIERLQRCVAVCAGAPDGNQAEPAVAAIAGGP
jgi:hypothetical protein